MGIFSDMYIFNRGPEIISEIFIIRAYDDEGRGWWFVDAPIRNHPTIAGIAYADDDRLQALGVVVNEILKDPSLKLANSVQITTSV